MKRLISLIIAICANSSFAMAQPKINQEIIMPKNIESNLPNNWNQNPRFMEIFVRSYQDSDGDGIGDIRGIIARLDYLQKLGINAIWLMPVHPSEDKDHGYAVEDYREIAPEYGTIADMELLIKEAHKRGIGIILDFVINHSSSTHPFFEDAASSKDSKYRDYYIFSSNRPNWGEKSNSWRMKSGKVGFYYGAFDTSMPDWNLRNPAVREYLKSSMRFWLEKGIDGFRFDAVTMLLEDGPEKSYRNAGNQAILQEFRATIHDYKNRFMICEVSEKPEEYVDACDHTFAFGAQQMIVNSAKKSKLEKPLIDWLNSPLRDKMPLTLQSHDFYVGDRLFDQFGKNNLDQYKIAAAIAILSVPVSFTYYGEEIGMGNLGEKNDVGMRAPMSWSDKKGNADFSKSEPYRKLAKNYSEFNLKNQAQDSNSLFYFYRELLLMKWMIPILSDGKFNLISKEGDDIYAFERYNDNIKAIVVVNMSNQAKKFNFTANSKQFINFFEYKSDDYLKEYNPNQSDNIEINLAPYQTKVLVGE